MASGPALAQVELDERWHYLASANSEYWVSQDISFGDRGSQVFAHLGQGDPIVLLSTHSAGAATPAWTEPNPDFERPLATASAADAAVHASLTTGGQSDVVLRRFRGSTDQPRTNVLPSFGARAGVRVTPDGSRIVASSYVGGGQTQVSVFDAASSSPLRTLTLNTSPFVDFAIDERAETLFATSTSVQVFDLDDGSLLDTLSGSVGGGALSPDGTRYAIEKDGRIELHRRLGSTYVQDWTFLHGVDAANVELRFSRDGSSIAVAYTNNDLRAIAVQALDLTTRQLVLNDGFTGGATGFQNYVTALAVSDRGDRLAVGISGDAGALHEVRVYDLQGSQPAIQTLDCIGSCTDLDLSGDGKRLVVAIKDAHLNQFSPGRGEIRLFDLDPRDFEILSAPSAGDIVQIRVRGGAGNELARLLTATEAANRPRYHVQLDGVLYLKRRSTGVSAVGSTNAWGEATLTYRIPNAPGSELCLQGLTSSLTGDWERITILP